MESKPKFRLFPWLFRWKFWRSLLLVVAVLITLLALYHAEENWRGRRAWETYKKAMEAKGVSFDFNTYVPPAVPDDQNFAMTPFLAPLFEYVPGTQTPIDTNAATRAFSLTVPFKSFRDEAQKTWIEGKPLDLAGLVNGLDTNKSSRANLSPSQSREAALEILENLKPDAPILTELETASHRPYSRFNVDYDLEMKAGIVLRHLGVLRNVCSILECRASAELTLRQTNAAFQDISLMYHLMNSIRSEPFLVSEVARVGYLMQMLQPLWEGLSQHQWSDEQLAGFAQQLQKLNFLDDGIRVLSSESHLFDSFFVELRSNGSAFLDIDTPGDATRDTFTKKFVGALVPSGWFYFEQLNYHRLFDAEVEGVMSPKEIDPAVADKKDSDVQSELAPRLSVVLHHYLIARILLPSVSNFEYRMAQSQSYVNLATIACALERYRLAHGEYPESLDALAPEYLSAIPRDVIMDHSLKYQHTPDGQFILYSVGWNKADDGGTVAKNTRDKTKGDWVWRYTPAPLAK